MLEEEIEQQKLRGITQAEMNEIEENFSKANIESYSLSLINIFFFE